MTARSPPKSGGQLLKRWMALIARDIAVKTINGTGYLSGFVTTDAQRTKSSILAVCARVRAVEVSIGQYK